MVCLGAVPLFMTCHLHVTAQQKHSNLSCWELLWPISSAAKFAMLHILDGCSIVKHNSAVQTAESAKRLPSQCICVAAPLAGEVHGLFIHIRTNVCIHWRVQAISYLDTCVYIKILPPLVGCLFVFYLKKKGQKHSEIIHFDDWLHPTCHLFAFMLHRWM